MWYKNVFFFRLPSVIGYTCEFYVSWKKRIYLNGLQIVVLLNFIYWGYEIDRYSSPIKKINNQEVMKKLMILFLIKGKIRNET